MGTPLDTNQFDFLFTEHDLQNLFGIIDAQEHPQNLPTASLPPQLAAETSALALQFQPHHSPELAQELGAHGGRPVKPEAPAGFCEGPLPGPADASVFGKDALGGAGLGAVSGAPAGLAQPRNYQVFSSAGPGMDVHAVTNRGRPSLDGRGSLDGGPCGRNGGAPPPTGALPKPAPRPPREGRSHSTIEKQRRDRINSLIDELRDLVPPQPSGNGEAVDPKRPKHVVLADTISLVRDLQDKLRMGQDELQRVNANKGRTHSADSGSTDGELSAARALMEQTFPNTQQHSDERSDLPSAPEGLPPSGEPGVTVVPSGDRLFVKVHCRDRRGLLADIIASLRALPLEVMTAAVTTTGSGFVHDVFECTPDTEGVPTDVIREAVLAALCSARDKRPRPL